MGFWDLFKRREDPPADPRINHIFTDGDREAAGQARIARMQVARLKSELEMQQLKLDAEKQQLSTKHDILELKQKIEDLEGDEYEEEGGSSIEDTLMTALAAKFLGGAQPASQPVIQPPARPVEAPAVPEITDDQIAAVWKAQPKATQKFILALDDEQIGDEIAARMPGISEESIERAISFIKKQRKY